jgi:glycine cleavage system H protein
MQAAAGLTVLSGADQTCVWMDAGVLRFKLCDRDFECHRCPLHAALQGGSGRTATQPGDSPAPPREFPDDRLYAPGHTWIAPVDPDHGIVRLGLDAFAASLLGAPRRIRRLARPFHAVDRADPLCDLWLKEGVLPIATPIAGRVVAWNEALADSPSTLATDPYGTGWVLEMEPDGEGAQRGLSRGTTALQAAAHDARQFCHGAAIHLLESPEGLEVLSAESVCAITDLRALLGPGAFLGMVRELVF